MSLCSRFGGSQSSQSQAASQATDRTAALGTDTAAGKVDCFSEEGDDSKDFDPFLSLGESDATKCEQEASVALVMAKADVKWCQIQRLHAFSSSGSGWVANFGEVNSKAPAAGVGFSAWGSPDCQPAATESEEKGWAKFTDFQPFCW